MTDPCPMVRCCDLQVCVGGVQVIKNVTFDCCRGDWVVLTGRSGAGKTTLLRTINGLCPPTAGRVWAIGSWIPGRSRIDAHRAWRSTGTVLQELALFSTKSASANVEIGLRAAGHDRKAARREARDWLERFGLGDKAGEFPANLSGGERQRVAIARAIAHQPQLLILDEPTSHLDHGSARIVLSAIHELVQHGSTVVMASHREEEVDFAGACRIVLDDGYVKEVCSPV
jgi:ABC-type multidrug transport system ATPase subunit